MKKWPWFFVSLVVVVVDQLSKYWALNALSPYEPQNIMPMLDLTLAFNTGAAFSFLSTLGALNRWLLAGFSFLMSTVIIIWIVKLPQRLHLQLLALSLVLGGAVGNLIDRAANGYVVDFILIYYKNYHWPVFNLADTAICIGAFLLIIDFKNLSSKSIS
ncbi:lipoprotein signal peptidase [Legionella adelaidensis]|uniref:Lipoprotein signal peptidase n=1 Tax=Legionella adelaidensis TaxID=45056 RepID=A0A0W0R411_9GAMM|nr:signal peptidase II [Legionella adelaidensis]KTC65770.1 lipoprotein signal peptidase [Legionella adelaidensis]